MVSHPGPESADLDARPDPPIELKLPQRFSQKPQGEDGAGEGDDAVKGAEEILGGAKAEASREAQGTAAELAADNMARRALDDGVSQS